MRKKFDFLENETKILFHEAAHDGAIAATELWKRIKKAMEFIDGDCHPDFHSSFLDGLLKCVQEEQKLRGINGPVTITTVREWGD